MQFSWDEQTIRWFVDASAYTGFHKALAQRIIPYLEQDYTLCDAGCGIGRLDLELAPYVRELTAVDLSDNAISALRQDALALGLNNIRAEVRDVESLTESYDAVLLSFFGQDSMFDLLKHCRRKLIRIVDADDRARLYPERHQRHIRDTVAVVSKQLEEKSISFELELVELEFGQPLRSWQDAEKFVLSNAPESPSEEVHEFLKKRIVETGRDDFPFYMPKKKGFGIFVMDKEKQR